jgi:uncharacterized surface protein with fasciclin (FAS1) repeats
MRAIFATVVTALAAVTLSGCGGDSTTTKAPASTPAPATLNIVELAQTVPALSSLVDLLIAHNLTDTLSGPGPFTVFAPTNEAFTNAQDVIATLSDDQITQVLTYHVVAGVSAVAADLSQGQILNTVFADHDLVVQTITPSVTIQPDGEGASDATVTTADQMATNGVVHIVDTVLVPSLASAPTPPYTGPSTTAAPTLPNIVELAQSVPDLSSLVDLLVSHNLTDTLSGPGPFTVFAPTNAAFTAASDVIATLSDSQVTDVLTYHVVPDVSATAASLSQGDVLTTVFAAHNLVVATITPSVTIHPDGAGASDATVTTADQMASNGVVHIVDAVLVPDLSAATTAPPVQLV